MILFSIISPPSFQNVKLKWHPEIQHHSSGVPIILVGAKSDLRNDRDTMDRLREKNLKHVSEKEGVDLANELGASKCLEC